MEGKANDTVQLVAGFFPPRASLLVPRDGANCWCLRLCVCTLLQQDTHGTDKATGHCNHFKCICSYKSDPN